MIIMWLIYIWLVVDLFISVTRCHLSAHLSAHLMPFSNFSFSPKGDAPMAPMTYEASATSRLSRLMLSPLYMVNDGYYMVNDG